SSNEGERFCDLASAKLPEEGKRARPPRAGSAPRGQRTLRPRGYAECVQVVGRSRCSVTSTASLTSARGSRRICWGVSRDGKPTPCSSSRTPSGAGEGSKPEMESCDVCGSQQLIWRSCKLVCTNCRSILKSCADL